MEWTDQKVLEMIEEYRARPILWDPTCADYKLSNKKNDSWRSLAAVMTTNVVEVKKKMNSLLASLRRERNKEKKKSGMAATEVYKSSWFAYIPMAFLLDKYKVKDTKSSEDIVQDNNEEENNVDVDVEIHMTESGDVQDNEVPEKHSQSTSSGSDLKRKANWNNATPNKSRMKKVDEQLKDVVDIISNVGNKIGANKPSKSADDAFGEYIASKMRAYSHKTKSIIQHKINNLLFEADMGMYEQPPHTVPVTISDPQDSTTNCSSNTSPSLLLSNDEGTQLTFLTLSNDK